MPKSPLALTFVLTTGLSACVYAGPEPVEGPYQPLPIGATCPADAWQGLVGQNRGVLAGLALPERTRIIGPGQAVTMDYFEGRLNISYDRAGRIDRVYCG
ncbi:MAG: hypothetical protein RIR62_1616 [Pseudomonadota bacterium]|jgi:hypothetical protein